MELSRAQKPRQQFFDFDGVPLSGGTVCTYLAGTTEPVATYKDNEGNLNQVEVRLDSRGECDMWLDPKVSYKFVLKRADGSVVNTDDNVTASAHVKAVRRVVFNEDDFNVTEMGEDVVVIESKLNAEEYKGYVDDSVAALKTNILNGEKDWKSVSSFVTETTEGFVSWSDNSLYVNDRLGLAMLNINCFAKVSTEKTLQGIYTLTKYKPIVDLCERIGSARCLQLTASGAISGFDADAGPSGSFFRHTFVYPFAR